jgi:hypothetical protein
MKLAGSRDNADNADENYRPLINTEQSEGLERIAHPIEK